MRFMKITVKRAVVSFIALIGLSAGVSASNSAVSLRTGYISRHETASAGLSFRYRFTPRFALAPSIDYIFRHHDYDGLMLNVDGHFLLPFSTEKVEFYPLAGVNFSSWSNYMGDSGVEDDTTRRVSRWGVNVGAGAALNITRSFRLGIEAKYIGVKSNSSAALTFSIGYNF